MLVGLAVLVLAAMSPPARRFLKSVLGFAGAKLDNAAEGVAGQDAIGQYKSKIANAVESGRNASKVVDRAATTLVSLENQIADELKDQQRLTNRIQAVMANGDPNKTAQKYALELERVERNLAANQAQKAQAQASYDENLHLRSRSTSRKFQLPARMLTTLASNLSSQMQKRIWPKCRLL